MKIKIPVSFKNGTNLIDYPESPDLFKNGYVEGEFIICEYLGENTDYEEYIETNKAPSKMSALAFMGLVGDANMVSLLSLAKTDPGAELLVKKIDRADVIDFEDEERGPAVGMQYLLSQGQLSQSEHDRIMRREFL